MYKKFKNLDEFYSLRPDPTETQRSIVSAFYRARREIDSDHKIPSALLKEHAETLNYEIDLAVTIMQKLDDYYLSLRAEKFKRDLDKK